jgi:hypothetical protein
MTLERSRFQRFLRSPIGGSRAPSYQDLRRGIAIYLGKIRLALQPPPEWIVDGEQSNVCTKPLAPAAPTTGVELGLNRGGTAI